MTYSRTDARSCGCLVILGCALLGALLLLLLVDVITRALT